MTKSYIKDYPRPQFVRRSWETLNGVWEFAFDDRGEGESSGWLRDFPAERRIEVPFTYETKLSGIGESAFHNVVWYHRSFTPYKTPSGHVILHFEGSDYHTRVFINEAFVGEHTGGYARFSFDITAFLTDGENSLTVRVEDSRNLAQPRGKQRWTDENFGCWYVQTTGIWKTVWLEYLPGEYIRDVRMTPRLSDMSLELEWRTEGDYDGDLTFEAEITFGGVFINRATLSVIGENGRITLPVFSPDPRETGVRTWSPEHPNLYDIRLRLYRDGVLNDEVLSYFGMREIKTADGKILLNGFPFYQRLVLDQGYWRDSYLTPPDERAIIEDIEKTLALGFNGARKHQKIEDERYAYWCDVLGLVFWCEMPSPYVFSEDSVSCFTSEWTDIVRQFYNHPSLITWTPFNESWGVPQIKSNARQQGFTEAIYHLTKSLDSTRPVISNDGWEHTVGDILTLHDYVERGDEFFARYMGEKDGILDGTVFHNGAKTAFADGYSYRGQPVIISEYGGAAFSGGKTGEWGYGSAVDSRDALLRRIDDMTTAIKRLPYVSGYCYTQLTDVQQEINGLLDEERVFKTDSAAIREINLKKV